MVLYPDVQKQAQGEIDRVIGQDRLPTLADWDSLPYVGAIVKEVLRWHPVTPQGKHLECPYKDPSHSLTLLDRSSASPHGR